MMCNGRCPVVTNEVIRADCERWMAGSASTADQEPAVAYLTRKKGGELCPTLLILALRGEKRSRRQLATATTQPHCDDTD